MNVLPEVYVCSLRKKDAPLLPERTLICTLLADFNKFTKDANGNQ